MVDTGEPWAFLLFFDCLFLFLVFLAGESPMFALPFLFFSGNIGSKWQRFAHIYLENELISYRPIGICQKNERKQINNICSTIIVECSREVIGM